METQEATTRESEPSEVGESEVAEQVADMLRAVHEGEPLKDVMGVDGAVVDAAIEQAYTFYDKDRFEKAATLAEGARALDVTRFYPHLLLGDIYMRRGDLATAEEEFERALEIRPESSQATLKLAETEIRLSCEDEARELLSELLEAEKVDEGDGDRARVLMELIE